MSEIDEKRVLRGARLREARKKAGVSMKVLGKKIGVSEQAISQYELGKRPVDFDAMVTMANYLGADANWIMHGQTLEERNAKRQAELDKMYDDAEQRLERHKTAVETVKKLPAEQQDAIYTVIETMGQVKPPKSKAITSLAPHDNEGDPNGET